MTSTSDFVDVDLWVELQGNRVDTITGWLKTVGYLINVVAAERQLPETSFTIVIADDFAGAVSEIEGDTDSAFTTERLGGSVVAGKCLEGYQAGHYFLVLDGAAASGVGAADAYLIYLVAHEMTHALLGHARYALGYEMRGQLIKGIADVVPDAAVTACEALEEWRADVLADIVLGQLATVNVGGGTDPVSGHDLHGDGYAEGLEAVMDDLHPGLINLVARYRLHRMSLEKM